MGFMIRHLVIALLALSTLAAAAPGAPATAQAEAPSQSAAWSWPLLPAPGVVQQFQAPPEPWAAGHRGVDLAAAVGQTVFASGAGRISFSGMVAGRPVLVVQHSAGERTTLEPVRGLLPVGATVARGQAIGRVDPTPGHCIPATCVHWGFIRDGSYLDPLTLVGRGPPILLPPLGVTASRR